MVRSWSGRWAVLVVLAAVGATGCGATSTDIIASEVSAVATDYRTLPPPTTTIPPTTTAPLQAGDVIAGEATYVVAEGDYPYVVANRFGVDFDAFIAINGWTVDQGVVPEWPPVGTTIKLPAGAIVPDDADAAGRVTPLPTTTTIAPPPDAGTPTGTNPDGTGADGSAPVEATTTTTGCDTYTVADGDYPTKVAGKLGVTVDELAAANKKTKGYDAFYVGLVIKVPC